MNSSLGPAYSGIATTAGCEKLWMLYILVCFIRETYIERITIS